MTPKQKKRLVRNAIKGNKLASIRMASLLRKSTPVVSRAAEGFVAGIFSMAEAQREMQRAVRSILVEDIVRHAVRKLVRRVVAQGGVHGL